LQNIQMKKSFHGLSLVVFFAMTMHSPAFGREPEWTFLELPHFTVLSSAPEKETRDWAVEFEQFRRGMSQIIAINERDLRPVTVVLFRSDSEMRAYKPLENGKPEKIAGLFSRSSLGNYIELSVEERANEYDDIVGDETRHTIFHEGVHWLTSSLKVSLPLWLDEGLAETFSTFYLKDKSSFVIGEALPWHVALLREEQPLPLSDLMTISRSSLLYNEGNRTSIFYAESWELAHYLLFADDPAVYGKINELVNSLATASSPDKAFKQVYGFGCAEMEKKMRDYLYRGRFHEFKLDFDRSAIEQEIKTRAATPAEVETMLGSLLVAVDRTAEANSLLTRANADAPDDPRPLEALSELAEEQQDADIARIYLERAAEKAAGNIPVLESLARHAVAYELNDDALNLYERAAAAGSQNFDVWFFLGSTYFEQAGLIDAIVSTDIFKTRKAEACFEQAIESDPGDYRSYQLLAATMGSLTEVAPIDGKLLEEGLRLEPNDPIITTGLAIWEIKTNKTDQARERLGKLPAPGIELDNVARRYLDLALTLVGDAVDEETINDFLREDKLDDANEILNRLMAHSISAEKRAQLAALQLKIGERMTLRRAQQLVDSKQPELAEALLDGLLGDPSLDTSLRTQAQALRDKLK
jgi:tetratricopeptide (TPR) repeat protein